MKQLEKMEERLPAALQNKGTAWAVLILCVLAAVFGMGGAQLRLEQKTVKNQYEQRVNPEFSARAEAAQNLLKLCDKLHFADTDALEDALDAFDEAVGPARSAADLELEKQINVLGKALEQPAKEAGKQELLEHQLAEFESRGRIAQYELEEYNHSAEKFNQELADFPASLIRLVWGIEKLEYCV